jgi:adenylosuccinate synthase
LGAFLVQIVLLSGNVSAGKTTLANSLSEGFGFQILKTKDVLRSLAGKGTGRALEPERSAMQKFGEKLDRDTEGKWVLTALTKSMRMSDGTISGVVVDAVRIKQQIDAIRRAHGFSVTHIHIKAPVEILADRYKQRTGTGVRELATYKAVERNPTEAGVQSLEEVADVVIDTDRCMPKDVLVRAATHLGLYCREYSRAVDVLVGGQYGSEGKGHIASYLAREYDVMVRVGGPNAGHKVFLSPEPYTHHQLPSGTWRNSEATLILAPGCVLNVKNLLKEIADCRVGKDRLAIDPQAMIITDADIRREKELVRRIGSTGQGVGSATARRIEGRASGVTLARDVKDLRPFIRETWTVLEKAYKEGAKVLVEGTQGTGLSIFHGNYPHVTSRDTSVAGCLSEAGISPSRLRKVIMVCRTHPIRVESPKGKGLTSGPMSREIKWDTVSKRSGIPVDELKRSEKTSTTHRQRRVAEFDWALLRRASALNGPTDIALTFVDYISPDNQNARRFEQLDKKTINFIEEVERVAAAPISLISTRFGFRSIIDRRAW